MYFNAHCHLELGFAAGKIPPGLAFCDWILEVIRLRRETEPSVIIGAATKSLQDMAAKGISQLWDIDSMNLMADVYQQSSVRVCCFQELIALSESLTEQRIQEKLDIREAHSSPGMFYGLSPHAPYSASGRLIQAATNQAQQMGEWLCIHAAETEEEVTFTQSGRGPLREMLEGFGAIPDYWQPPGLRPIEYLHQLGVLGPKTLLVHCNHTTEQERNLIRETGSTVVLCPGTHAYFCRGAFPLKELLNSGCKVLLGTDSLASNESLDMERELKLAKEFCPDVNEDLLWEMIRV